MMDLVYEALDQLRTELKRRDFLRNKHDIKGFVIHDSDYIPHNQVIDFYGWSVLIVRSENSSFTVGISEYKVEKVNEDGELEWFLVPNVSIDYMRSQSEYKRGVIKLDSVRVSIAEPYLIMTFDKDTTIEGNLMKTLNIKKYKLIIFDGDGTLWEFKTFEVLPGVRDWFDSNDEFYLGLATNQGGVGMKHWMETGGFGEPEKYPSATDIYNGIDKVCHELGIDENDLSIQICFRYLSTKGNWSPVPDGAENDERWNELLRKPNPQMLINLMEHYDVSPAETLMVGDRDEDELAAENADCDFIHADVFFNRVKDKTPS